MDSKALDDLIVATGISAKRALDVKPAITQILGTGLFTPRQLMVSRRSNGALAFVAGKVSATIIDSSELSIEIPRKSFFANEIYGGIHWHCSVEEFIKLANIANSKDGEFTRNLTDALYDYSNAAEKDLKYV